MMTLLWSQQGASSGGLTDPAFFSISLNVQRGEVGVEEAGLKTLPSQQGGSLGGTEIADFLVLVRGGEGVQRGLVDWCV